MAANKSDPSGLLSGFLSDPSALQKLLSVITGLKESGALDKLLPLAQSFAGKQTDTEKEEESKDASPAFQVKSKMAAETVGKTAEELRGSADPDASDSLPAFSEGNAILPLLTSLLSGGASIDASQKSGQTKQSEQTSDGGGNKKDDDHSENRYADHRRLLQALRPYLSAQRREKIDFILGLLQFIELAGKIGFGELFFSRK